MALLRSGRCPACRSDKVSIISPINLKMLFGLNLAILFVAGSFGVGLIFSRMAVNTPGFRDIAEVAYYWNWIITLPVAVILGPLYFIIRRGTSKKRLCRNCGKKWKVRHRSDNAPTPTTTTTPMPQSAGQAS